MTLAVSKQLLPVYDKPMIYYPLSTLMLAKVREILIISTREDIGKFEDLLGDGHQFGLELSYAIQESPDGLVQAFIIGEKFIGDDTCTMILGDNIFYGSGFSPKLLKAVRAAEAGRATVFGYYVDEPENFGVVEFDEGGHVVSIEEKPLAPKSNYAVTGLYFYPSGVAGMAKQVSPSPRGELEITTMNEMYLQDGKLNVEILGRGFAWMDAGTMDSLLDAAEFVRMVEDRQSVKISAPEEVAYRQRWISREALLASAERYGKSAYGKHLKAVAYGRMKW